MCFHEAGFYHCPSVLRDLCLRPQWPGIWQLTCLALWGKVPEMDNELVNKKCFLSYRQSVVDSRMKR